MSPTSAGYSGTPLPKKLGIAERSRLVVRHAPDDYARMLAPIPQGTTFEKTVSKKTDIVHVFSDRKALLKTELAALRTAIRSDAVVWISWPKKTSRVPTDVTEDTIRELALPLGFVDVKVCAVSDVWSGLKLVVRKELR